jgi:hypothetical protein
VRQSPTLMRQSPTLMVPKKFYNKKQRGTLLQDVSQLSVESPMLTAATLKAPMSMPQGRQSQLEGSAIKKAKGESYKAKGESCKAKPILGRPEEWAKVKGRQGPSFKEVLKKCQIQVVEL